MKKMVHLMAALALGAIAPLCSAQNDSGGYPGGYKQRVQETENFFSKSPKGTTVTCMPLEPPVKNSGLKFTLFGCQGPEVVYGYKMSAISSTNILNNGWVATEKIHVGYIGGDEVYKIVFMKKK